MMVEINIVKNEVTPFVRKLIRNLDNPRPALEKIGILEKSQTQQRFRRQVDPTGTPWQPLSQRTINEKGSSVILKRTGRLQGSIEYRVVDNNVFIGTNVKYGKKHQFGDGVPLRPFLGVNQKTVENVRTVFRKFMGF